MAAQSKLAVASTLLGGSSSSSSSFHMARSIVARLTDLYLAHRTRIQRAVYLTLLVAVVHRARNAIAEQKAASVRAAAAAASATSTKNAARAGSPGSDGVPGADATTTTTTTTTPSRKRVELDRDFFRALLRLLRIVVPGWRSPEARLLLSHSFFLVVRTLISLRVAAMDGAIVKSLVKGNGREFLARIVWWMVIAVPATFTNSMVGAECYQQCSGPCDIPLWHLSLWANCLLSQLSYHQAELSLKYRARLTQHIHDQYLSQLTFYGISALDDRIKNPDQLIAVDVAKFSNSLAELYSNLAKPLLDMVSCAAALTH